MLDIIYLIIIEMKCKIKLVFVLLQIILNNYLNYVFLFLTGVSDDKTKEQRGSHDRISLNRIA